MGTPYYLSPEQIEGKKEIDIRSDIYSLGTTVYEMLTGRPPFEGGAASVVMMKHLKDQVDSPHDIDRKISLGFCHILEKMMAKDPAERYQTPAELSEDLALIKEGKPPRGPRLPPGRSTISYPKDELARLKAKAEMIVQPARASRKEEFGGHPKTPSPKISSGGKIDVVKTISSTRITGSERPKPSRFSSPTKFSSERHHLKWFLLGGVIVAILILALLLIHILKDS
jgi:serine/threonine protein kinase